MLSIIYAVIILFNPVNDSIESHDLTIKIDGLKNEYGVIYMAVFDREESFLDEKEIFTYRKIIPRAPITEIVLKDLPEGKYAVTVYHDLNMDEKLNCYLLGIPKEPFGFSNNPKIISGKPGFHNTSFDLISTTDITIKLKNL